MRIVRVAPGYRAVPLPDGRTYNQGQTVRLSEAQWAQVPSQIVAQLILVSTHPDPNPAVIPDTYDTAFQGPPGPQGPTGPTGPQGPAGTPGAGLTTVTPPLEYDSNSGTLSLDVDQFDPAGAADDALTQANAYTDTHAAVKFTFQQSTPQATWTITHPLGGAPTVLIVDSANQEVYGTVTYLSASVVQVEFSSPFSGTAYLT